MLLAFKQGLFDLFNIGHIAYEEAIRNADSANGLRLQIKLNGARKEPGDTSGAASGPLELNMIEEEAPAEEEKPKH